MLDFRAIRDRRLKTGFPISAMFFEKPSDPLIEFQELCPILCISVCRCSVELYGLAWWWTMDRDPDSRPPWSPSIKLDDTGDVSRWHAMSVHVRCAARA